MPNETSNLLEIFGPHNDINSFIDSHRKFMVYPVGIYWYFEVSVPIVNENNKNMSIRKEVCGTSKGTIKYINKNTPNTSCFKWFNTMIKNYPALNFVLKFNDEYCYGWAVACKGELIGGDEVCLHRSSYTNGIEIYKDEPEIILE
jgi:hypothetical protein